jgi:crotonobetainyl-CoA:carnitine CoA-transferase CaiB-like acyl-CoA transferase
MTMSKLPLEGIRVIDVSMWFAGPMAGRLLADMGAEIIKIESIKHIDPWRGPVTLTEELRNRFPTHIETDEPYNCSPGFNLQNRNKQGVTLDLGEPRGKQLFKELVTLGDIVLENYSPSVMGKLGFDYDILKEINPGIIMMSMPAFGLTGPDKDFRAFGQTIDCVSGMANRTGYEGEEPMLQSGLSYGDPLSGMNAAFAILAALHHRRKSGEGMHIELSQAEGLIAFNADAIMDYTMNSRMTERMGNHHPSMAPHNAYPCKEEDKWVAIAVSSDGEWERFCRAVDEPSWIDDSRFYDGPFRHRNQDELDQLIAEWTSLRDSHEVMNILQKAGIAAGAVLDAKELLEDPHLESRGFFETVTHPEAGTHPYIGMYAKFSKTPGSIRKPAPLLGEDNEYVFGELLGLSQAEMDRLVQDGIIGTTPTEKQQGSMY